MPELNQRQRNDAAGEKLSLPLRQRLLVWMQRAWRPAATALAVALAVALTAHVVNGHHGLQVWLQKRAEDRQLRQDIQQLESENARLRQRIEHLKSDPEAIEHEAREKLHYAKPGEVIYTLPAQQTPPPAAAGK
jgi:cell division protein FtsB